MSIFKSGDEVQLFSGGHWMTVSKIITEGRFFSRKFTIECLYFDNDGELKKQEFAEEELILLKRRVIQDELKSDRSKFWLGLIRRITFREISVLFAVAFFGIICWIIAIALGNNDSNPVHVLGNHSSSKFAIFLSYIRELLRELGLALLPLALIAFLYELIIRHQFVETVSRVVKEQMPSHYSEVKKSGIVDVFPSMKIDNLIERIDNLYNSEIRICDITIEHLPQLQKSLVDAVLLRNCKVKLMIWYPLFYGGKEPLRLRAHSLGNGYDIHHMLEGIYQNLKLIKGTRDKLRSSNINFSLNFEVKLFKSFITHSFYGYGDECLVGNYLRGRISSRGTQLKVNGRNRYFFNELSNHFDREWSDKETTIRFEDSILDDIEILFRTYLGNKHRFSDKPELAQIVLDIAPLIHDKKYKSAQKYLLNPRVGMLLTNSEQISMSTGFDALNEALDSIGLDKIDWTNSELKDD